MSPANGKPRARDLGLPFEGRTGEFNAITDIPGVEVGLTTIIRGEGPLQVGRGPVRTGVTAVLPRGKKDYLAPVWAGQFDLNGNGEMTGAHWINDAGYFIGPICLTNTHSVGMAHHAAVGWMIDQYPGFFLDDHGWAMPVVAETYDGLTNDICGRHVTEEHVLKALRSARTGPVAEGNTGGGTGMMTYEFKGGTGTSSRRVALGDEEFTIGALVQSNYGTRKDLNILGVPVGRHLTENALLTTLTGHETGSIIVILGTDIPLLPIQLHRLAKRAALGIGRTGSPGGHYSGDIFLAFSTANDMPLAGVTADQELFRSLTCLNDHYLDDAYSAAVQAIEEAVVNAMVAAESMATIKPPGYTIPALDHRQLIELMKSYNRWKA